MTAQWYIGLCYYDGRGGVDRDVAMAWFRKSAAQVNPTAAEALQSGIPGQAFRKAIVRFTNAGFAPLRYALAHEFAEKIHEACLKPQLQACTDRLQEFDAVVPHHSLRGSVWVEVMLAVGLSEEDLEVAKHMYAYSKRTCAFCGSNSAPLRNCSLCMELRYCIGTDCQHDHWNKAPAAESHKVLCPRIFVRGSKGRIRRV
jgi:hypothetical protein